MGHERIGILPRRKPWANISQNIYRSLNEKNISSIEVGRQTLNQVRTQYEHLHTDRGVQAAFSFLVALSTPEKKSDEGNLTDVQISLPENPSPLNLSAKLKNYVNQNKGSSEYAELATRAATDAIFFWTKQKKQQQLLFSSNISANDIWNNFTGREFCYVSRTFFAKLTERYLYYFLDRGLSAQSQSISSREVFTDTLSEHINDISNHAFETSNITQSFAAGWFNKYTKEKRPNDGSVKEFLRVVSGKLREELLREQFSK